MRELIRKEILNNLLNLRFSLAYLLCSFLLIGSAAAMLSDYLTDKKLYETNSRFFAREDGDNSRGMYQNRAQTILRQPALLRVFVAGNERDPDSRADIKMNGVPYFHAEFRRNPLIGLFPAVDMVFIVGVILSLLIFVLTFDAISGEREEGTLKVLLASPIPRDSVILAKWLGGIISLAAPLLIGWLLVLVVLVFTPSLSVTPDDWARIFGIGCASVLYVAAMFSFSMMVSAMVRSSSTSVLTLLFSWAVLVVAVPSLSAPAAYLLLRPLPVQRTELGVRTTELEANKKLQEEMLSLRKELEKQVKADSTQVGRVQEEAEKKWHASYERMQHAVSEGRIDQSRRRTSADAGVENLARWISRFSPFGCFQNACISLAGTGMDNERAWRESLQDFARRVFKFGYAVPSGDVWNEKLDMTQAPRFEFRRQPFQAAAAAGLLDLGVLAVMTGIFFLAAYVRFLRMDIV